MKASVITAEDLDPMSWVSAGITWSEPDPEFPNDPRAYVLRYVPDEPERQRLRAHFYRHQGG